MKKSLKFTLILLGLMVVLVISLREINVEANENNLSSSQSLSDPDSFLIGVYSK